MPKPYLPKEFKEKYERLLGDESSAFFESCMTKPAKSLIINRLKTDDYGFLKELETSFEKVRYLDNTFFIKSEVSGFGNLIEQNIGLFQMQEVSSILPAIVLDPKPSDIVLDLTAAPGNKTAVLAQLMGNRGLIIANDIDKSRLNTLIFTLKKQGVTNTVVTCQNGINFNPGFLFNRILLDAPCSCEGMVRKKPDLLRDWSEALVKSKAIVQKRLLSNAVSLLKDDGVLVYSTCTLSPEEDEEVIDYAVTELHCRTEEIRLPGVPSSNGLLEYNHKRYCPDVSRAMRLWPHKSGTEGFFICKLKKEA